VQTLEDLAKSEANWEDIKNISEDIICCSEIEGLANRAHTMKDPADRDMQWENIQLLHQHLLLHEELSHGFELQ